MRWSLLLTIGVLATAACAFPVDMAALLHGLWRRLGVIVSPVVGLAALWAVVALANPPFTEVLTSYRWHMVGSWAVILGLWAPISAMALLLGLWRRRVEIARYQAGAAAGADR